MYYLANLVQRSINMRTQQRSYSPHKQKRYHWLIHNLLHHNGENFRPKNIRHRETNGDSWVDQYLVRYSRVVEQTDLPSFALLRPISFSDSCKSTINSAGVKSSLCRTRGKFDVTLPNVCGGVVTIAPKTDRTRFLGSCCPLSIDTIRGR